MSGAMLVVGRTDVEPSRDEDRAPDVSGAAPAPPRIAAFAARTGGNALFARFAASRIVARDPDSAPAAAATGTSVSPVTPADEEAMAADVEFIVGKLSQQILMSGGEEEIVSAIRRWWFRDIDLTAAGTGEGTPFLDKFLLKLKLRVFTRRTARSGWIEQHCSAYDELWFELEDANLTSFKTMVRSSKKQGTSGPSDPQSENLWSTLGAEEGKGMLGLVGGLAGGLAGLADSGAKGITSLVNVFTDNDLLPKDYRVKLADPISYQKWVEEQYDFMGKQAFGDGWTKPTLGSWSAAEIGKTGGHITFALAMLGAGAGQAGTLVKAGEAEAALKTGLAALGVVGGIGGVADAGVALAADINRLLAANQNLKATDVLKDPQFQIHAIDLATSIFTAVTSAAGLTESGGGGLASTTEEVAKQQAAAKAAHLKQWITTGIGAALDAASAGAHIDRILELYLSELPQEQKDAAIRGEVEALLTKLATAFGQVAAAHDTDAASADLAATRAADQAEQQAAKRERYEKAVASAERAREGPAAPAGDDRSAVAIGDAPTRPDIPAVSASDTPTRPDIPAVSAPGGGFDDTTPVMGTPAVTREAPAAERLPTTREAPAVERQEPRSAPEWTSELAGRLVGDFELWSKMTPEFRLDALGRAANEQLVAQGLPKVKFVADRLGENTFGSFRSSEWVIRINEATLARPGMTAAEFAKLIETVAHESRHAQQYFLMAQQRAAALGNDPVRVSDEMKIPLETAEAAVREVKAGNAVAREGAAEVRSWWERTRGPSGEVYYRRLKEMATLEERILAIDSEHARLAKDLEGVTPDSPFARVARPRLDELAAERRTLYPEWNERWRMYEDAVHEVDARLAGSGAKDAATPALEVIELRMRLQQAEAAAEVTRRALEPLEALQAEADRRPDHHLAYALLLQLEQARKDHVAALEAVMEVSMDLVLKTTPAP